MQNFHIKAENNKWNKMYQLADHIKLHCTYENIHF